MKPYKKIDYMQTIMNTKKLMKHQKNKKRKSLKKKIAKEQDLLKALEKKK